MLFLNSGRAFTSIFECKEESSYLGKIVPHCPETHKVFPRAPRLPVFCHGPLVLSLESITVSIPQFLHHHTSKWDKFEQSEAYLTCMVRGIAYIMYKCSLQWKFPCSLSTWPVGKMVTDTTVSIKIGATAFIHKRGMKIWIDLAQGLKAGIWAEDISSIWIT